MRTEPFFDEKNRLVKETIQDGRVVRFYLGDDCQGVIHNKDGEEYVFDQRGKRRWRGTIHPEDMAVESEAMDDFGVILIKPDGVDQAGVITELLTEEAFTVLVAREMILTVTIVEELYPMFYHESYETPFFDYMTSGVVKAMIVQSDSCTSRLQKFKGVIRSRYGRNGHMRNMLHCSSSHKDALREASVLFCIGQLRRNN